MFFLLKKCWGRDLNPRSPSNLDASTAVLRRLRHTPYCPIISIKITIKIHLISEKDRKNHHPYLEKPRKTTPAPLKTLQSTPTTLKTRLIDPRTPQKPPSTEQ